MPNVVRSAAILSAEIVWVSREAAITVAVGLTQNIIRAEAYFSIYLATESKDELILIETPAGFVLEEIINAAQWAHAAVRHVWKEGSR